VVSRGDDSYKVGPSEMPGPIGPLEPTKEKEKPYTKLLLCGWKNDMYDLLSLLENIAAPGQRRRSGFILLVNALLRFMGSVKREGELNSFLLVCGWASVYSDQGIQSSYKSCGQQHQDRFHFGVKLGSVSRYATVAKADHFPMFLM
jgi:hypothetical protein